MTFCCNLEKKGLGNLFVEFIFGDIVTLPIIAQVHKLGFSIW